MRALLTFALMAWIPVVAQPDPAARLDSLLAEAHQCQARGDFRGAAASYRQALAIRPDVAELWSNLGITQHQAGDYGQAAEAFRKALRLNQALFVPNLFLGLDLLQLKQANGAVPYLLAAEKLNPRDPQVPLALGRAYHMLRDFERSKVGYQRAAALDPRSGEAWYGMGLAYFGLAETAGAKLTSSFPQSASVAELTAESLAEQDHLNEAIQAYRDLLTSKQSPPRCSRTSYGFVLVRRGSAADAEGEFERDAVSCPGARVGMARVLFEGGAKEKGLETLADLMRSDRETFAASLPRFWEGLDAPQLEKLLAQLSQSADAIAGVVAEAIRKGTRSEPVFAREGAVADLSKLAANDLERRAADGFFSGDFPSTALASDRLRKTDPNDPRGWYWALRANQKLGVAALARAGEVEPDSARIHALLGGAYQRRKMFDDALAEYSKVLAMSPDSFAALMGIAAALFADGRFDEARIAAEKALARSPADNEINLLMAEILVAQHEYAAAEAYLQHSLHVRPDLLPRVHALMGRVLARTGRPKDAIRELTQGLSSDEDGSVYYQLARLYQEAGDSKAAAVAFEKSKQIRTRHDELSQKALVPVN